MSWPHKDVSNIPGELITLNYLYILNQVRCRDASMCNIHIRFTIFMMPTTNTLVQLTIFDAFLEHLY